MPEVITTKAGPQCKDRLERDMTSNTFAMATCMSTI